MRGQGRRARRRHRAGRPRRPTPSEAQTTQTTAAGHDGARGAGAVPVDEPPEPAHGQRRGDEQPEDEQPGAATTASTAVIGSGRVAEQVRGRPGVAPVGERVERPVERCEEGRRRGPGRRGAPRGPARRRRRTTARRAAQDEERSDEEHALDRDPQQRERRRRPAERRRRRDEGRPRRAGGQRGEDPASRRAHASCLAASQRPNRRDSRVVEASTVMGGPATAPSSGAEETAYGPGLRARCAIRAAAAWRPRCRTRRAAGPARQRRRQRRRRAARCAAATVRTMPW